MHIKKLLCVPDSFKGTLSSAEICALVAAAAARVWPEAQTVRIPVADGGEGSIDALLTACGGAKVYAEAAGPFGEPIKSCYGRLDRNTAVLEAAAVAGLPMVAGRENPERTTTYGLGELMLRAVRDGCRRLIVCLGGSCTNDGGAGAAAAAGVIFRNAAGASFVPTGATLCEIAQYDDTALRQAFAGVDVTVMCDVDNPFCGPQGAAAVFAPQKGADPAMVKRLDAGLSHLAAVIRRQSGQDLTTLPGAGAAGGLGGGMAAFFGGRLQPGIDTVLDTVGFEALAAGADLVVTGEGRIDTQSLRGKVVLGVARRAKAAGVPAVALVGDIGDQIEAAYAEGLCGIFSINRIAAPYAEQKKRAASDLSLTAENLFRFMREVRP